VVVNTQSVALRLGDLDLPVCVCLDATFHQLANSPWFAPNALSRWFNPVTLGAVRSAERRILGGATRLFPWSEYVGDSLRTDYAAPNAKVQLLSPSLELGQLSFRPRVVPAKPRLLFVGSDFKRKGGPLLLEVFSRHFAERAELDVMTFAPLPPRPGVTVHLGVKAHSPEWRALWDRADAFVFPSTLETFGIVLLEAMAFGVPVISGPVGAAAELMGKNERGLLLKDHTPETLRQAMQTLLDDYPAATARATAARVWVEERHDVRLNARRLATILGECRKHSYER
jgi:glycosyltransferase involved in cell wall biosynthesis